MSVHTANQIAKLGAQMAARPTVAAAVTAGRVTMEQALAIGKAISDLPDDLDPSTVDECETRLLQLAAEFEPRALAKLADRVLAHVAPEVAEAALRARLDRDEARAAKSRSLTITSQGDGRSRISGWLTAEAAAVVTTALEPLCKPIREPDGSRDSRSLTVRRADALEDVCRLALATDKLPETGGSRPQLNVTVDFDTLAKQLGVGMLDTGEQISPTAVRRLACEAMIIPAVLGSNSEVLDFGQTRRLYTGATRRALEIRDRGCAFPGCERSIKWCEGHHMRSWVDGGDTSLSNGVLLCGHHHRFIHHSAWEVRLATDGHPEFIPPVHVDRNQRPRRNIYHRRP